jgi:hypothetical protein
MTTAHFPEDLPQADNQPANLAAAAAYWTGRPGGEGGNHYSRCDYVRYPNDPDKECYCPTREEAAEQRRYDERVAAGDPPEPYWVTAW